MVKNKKIPNGWERVKTDLIGNLLRGISYKKGDAINEPQEGYLPILRANNINGELNFSDLVYVPKKYIEDFQIIKAGDIVFAMSSGSKHLVGKSAVAKNDFDGSYGAFCSLLRINDLINKKYIAYIFKGNSYRKLISEIAKGTNINNLKREHILDFEISLPPLHEQNRIVAKIEELFSSLDKGIESLKTAQQQLKVYRQSVLKWAFEGKLTCTKDIKWLKLGEFCDDVEYGSAAKSKKQGKIPVLRMGNIQGGRFDWSDLVYTDNDDEIKKYSLVKDDVLFNRTNSSELVGKTALYKAERPAIFAGYLIRIKYKKDKIDPNYLNYYLNSHTAKNYGNSVKTFGVNQANINGTKLKGYPFPYIIISEQKRIVAEIESRLSVCDKIEESIEESLKQAEALRQSILKKAFEGKLVPQDPNDEPASKLLERIKAEKEKNKKVKR